MGPSTPTTSPPAKHAFVLYPRPHHPPPQSAASTFNIHYYLTTHMPFAAQLWGPYGFVGWSVTRLGPEQPFSVVTVLEWASREAFERAAKGPEAAELFGDGERLSAVQPVWFCVGDVVGKVGGGGEGEQFRKEEEGELGRWQSEERCWLIVDS